MPRITGPSIAEHVAAQEAAVLASARRLFTEHGVAAVSLGDIAADVGLGRTSIYRYFPTKAHILQRWFDEEMDPLVARSQAVVDDAAPAAALRAWLDLQLDFMADPAHAALMAASASSGELPDDVVRHIGARHRELYASLDPVLRAGGARSPEVRRTRALLVAGLIRSSADLVASGADAAGVRRELRRAAAAVVGL